MNSVKLVQFSCQVEVKMYSYWSPPSCAGHLDTPKAEAEELGALSHRNPERDRLR